LDGVRGGHLDAVVVLECLEETNAPPLNAPFPLFAFHEGAELRDTGAGSVSTKETPVTGELTTVMFETLPVGLEAFSPP